MDAARVARITGHTTTYIDQQMSMIEAKIWEQIYWSERNQERQERAFGKVAEIRCVPLNHSPEDELI